MTSDRAKQLLAQNGFVTTDSTCSRNALRYLDGEVSAGRLQKMPSAVPGEYAYVTKRFAKKQSNT